MKNQQEKSLGKLIEKSHFEITENCCSKLSKDNLNAKTLLEAKLKLLIKKKFFYR